MGDMDAATTQTSEDENRRGRMNSPDSVEHSGPVIRFLDRHMSADFVSTCVLIDSGDNGRQTYPASRKKSGSSLIASAN